MDLYFHFMVCLYFCFCFHHPFSLFSLDFWKLFDSISTLPLSLLRENSRYRIYSNIFMHSKWNKLDELNFIYPFFNDIPPFIHSSLLDYLLYFLKEAKYLIGKMGKMFSFPIWMKNVFHSFIHPSMDNEHLYNLYKIHSLSVIIKEREENETPQWKCYPFSFPFFLVLFPISFSLHWVFSPNSYCNHQTDDDNDDDDCCPAK